MFLSNVPFMFFLAYGFDFFISHLFVMLLL